jgi:predicted acylesterase/phospholipase RssA/CRP-like cAMP-binding protein
VAGAGRLRRQALNSLELNRLAFFEGLDAAALQEIAGRARPRHFNAGEMICEAGEAGNSLFVIRSGLAQVNVERPDGSTAVARLRRGDVVGEMSLLTGEPRSASVAATVPTEVLELDRGTFADVVAHFPTVLVNLSRILSTRLARTTVRQIDERRRGEAIALVAGAAGRPLLGAVREATRAASPRSTVALDLSGTLAETHPLDEPTAAGVLAALDDLLSEHGTTLVVDTRHPPDLPLLEQMDRVLVLADEDEAVALADQLRTIAATAELALLTRDPRRAPAALGGLRVARALDPRNPDRDVAWLGRHIARTKLGLSLGAGGAKGYAHVGALRVLQDAGYTIDYISGSSIGAIVGVFLGLGQDADAIDATLRQAFTPDNVKAMFKLSLAGASTGAEHMANVWRELTQERTFADLQVPLVMMSVDLNTRLPVPLTEGPLWEALVAATTVAGLFPPYRRDVYRLVDGVHLIPVPTASVIQAGADVTLSVNIMSRETLPAWPGHTPPDHTSREPGTRMLDTLLEVMDLAQLDASVRTAEFADVVVTPRFGPGTWREFHLADLFLEAGRVATEEQIPKLRALARPQGRI